MKIYSNLLRGASGMATAAACLFAMAFSTGCSADVDETLGYEMLPQNQKMIMRHLTFKGGKVIKFDTQNSTDDESVYIETPAPSGNFFETTLYRTDSLISSNITYGYLGVERSDTFGIRSAGFASTIMYMNSLDEETGFGYLPIFDTMKLVLSIDSYGGDTLTPVNYTVYELQKPLLGNLVSAEDTTAYIGCDLGTMYDASKPLFTFTFPNPDKNIGPSTTLLAMEPVDLSENGATWDFVRRLMLIPEDRSSENWDGYGREGMEVYEDEAKWIEFINGVCIVPDLSTIKEGERGALYDTRLSASGLSLQGRSRNPKDPTLIKDTVGMYYYFVDGTTTHGNISANSVRHDYTSGLNNGVAPLLASFNMESQDDAGNKIDRDSRTRTTLCYIEGVAGPVTELYFTDDFIDELKNLIKDEEGDFTLAGINQCLIYFYVTKADYDWMTTQANAATLTPYLNSSLQLPHKHCRLRLRVRTDIQFDAGVRRKPQPQPSLLHDEHIGLHAEPVQLCEHARKGRHRQVCFQRERREIHAADDIHRSGGHCAVYVQEVDNTGYGGRNIGTGPDTHRTDILHSEIGMTEQNI